MMMMWYKQYAVQSNGNGFKHNSLLFNNETDNAKRIVTKLGQSLAVTLVSRYFELGPQAVEELKKVNTYSFNIFNLRKFTDGNELLILLPYVLAKHGLFAHCKLEFSCMINFCKALVRGYKQITYHNQTHAADVCQTFNYFVTEGGMRDILKMDNFEMMSCLISAAMHDFEHPGVNSVFLISMNDEMAVRYNDLTVLENHHLAASFRIITQDPACNWAKNMSRADYKRTRHVII